MVKSKLNVIYFLEVLKVLSNKINVGMELNEVDIHLMMLKCLWKTKGKFNATHSMKLPFLGLHESYMAILQSVCLVSYLLPVC